MYLSVWFATAWDEIDADNKYKILLCSLYPVLIGLCKGVMQKLDYEVFEKREMIEFMSLMLADLPYRFFYFMLSEWAPGIILIGVKVVYKFVKFPI